jgi:hypothetical protein
MAIETTTRCAPWAPARPSRNQYGVSACVWVAGEAVAEGEPDEPRVLEHYLHGDWA